FGGGITELLSRRVVPSFAGSWFASRLDVEGSMDVGGELRAARRARKLTINDISRTTKIAPVVLRAIENNAFDTVPRGLFTRGFLRAYAREVGVDAESLVQRYRTQWEQPIVEVGAAAGAEPPKSAPEPHEPHESTSAPILQVCVIVIITIGYLASLRP